MLGTLTRGVVLIAGLACLGIVFYVADASALTVAFAIWVVSPYVLLFRATRTSAADTVRDGIILVAGAGMAGFALMVYVDAFFVRPDPQSGLVFLFIPFWQWCGVAVLMLALRLWSLRVRGRD